MKLEIKILFVISTLFMASAIDAKLYKWVDENGKVHYSDKVPPDQIKNAHQELNKNGVVKEEVQRALTPEEREARAEELKAQQELLEKQLFEQQRIEKERNTILKSYSNSGQITHLKNERILALKRNIQMAEENLVIQNRNLNDLLKRAADKERSGEVVSDTFLSQIEQIRSQIENQKLFIKEKSSEIEQTEERYNYEYEKYLEYTEGTNHDTNSSQ